MMIYWQKVYYSNQLDRFGIRLDQFMAKPDQVLWRFLDQQALKRDPLACYCDLREAEFDTMRPDFLPLLPQQTLVKSKLDLLESDRATTPRQPRLRQLPRARWPL